MSLSITSLQTSWSGSKPASMATSVASCTLFDVRKALRSYNADALKPASNSNDQLLVKDFYERLDETIEKELENRTF
jgi:hypothetical protein